MTVQQLVRVDIRGVSKKTGGVDGVQVSRVKNDADSEVRVSRPEQKALNEVALYR